MNTREQFGNYLLLKKLDEDPLGETFRAGRVGRQGMEEVVLLEVFNGAAVDGPAFWQKVSERGAIHDGLTSPNVAAGVDLGQVNNVPYVVYDYISGKNLASLQKQAAEKNSPIPADHALLIAERTALGLAAGYETRLDDTRILHGGLVPHQVMISNEGETRVLGFAVAPGVRDAAKTRAELARYLSPEARAGQPPHKADDVYSLGVILLELLAGKPVPADGDPGALLASATMQPEGDPLPDELKRLLQQSLASRDQRIGDVITWHKSLSKLMFEGQYNPTTFNLAFFMHNLFRAEIEKETQEIEVERTMKIPVPAAVSPPADTPPPSGDVRESTGVHEDTDVIRDKYGIGDEEKKGKKRNLALGIAAAALLVAAGVAGFFWLGPPGGAGDADATEEPAAQPAQAAQAEPIEPAGPTEAELAAQREAEAEAEAEEAARRQEELEAQIQSLLDKRLQETEKAYDQEIDQLRADLEAARQKAAESQQQAAQEAEARREAEATAAEPDRAAADEPAETGTPSDPAATPQTPPSEPADEQTAQAREDTGEPAASASEPVQQPTQTRETRTALPEAAPAEPPPSRGDLVGMGPGVTAPRLVSARSPRYPPVAQRLRKQATIVVKVLVDENGRVIETDLTGKEVGYGMDREAEAVAASSRWRPATKGGVPVKIWWQMPIRFALP